MKNHKVRLLMLGLMLLVLLTMAWRIFGKEDEASMNMPLSVSRDTVKLTTKPSVKPLPGNVEGLTSAIISSRFSGHVTNVLVEDGQSVEAGQPLFVMDSVELRNNLRVAQNNVNQTRARYNNDEDEYERYASLYEKGACSRQQLESYHTKMLASQADYDSAEANLSSARKQVADATVVSPVSGVIANKNLTSGQNVSDGSQVMTVEELDAVHIVIQVEQRDMAYLHMGSSVNITVDTYPDKVFTGHVNVISPVAGKESRMFQVKIKVDNPGQLLKPGMFVQAQVKLGEPRQVLSVPIRSVLGQKGIQYVFTEENGKAKKVRVETGDIIGDRIEITKGASENMVILTDNLDMLKDGSPLQQGEAQ